MSVNYLTSCVASLGYKIWAFWTAKMLAHVIFGVLVGVTTLCSWENT